MNSGLIFFISFLFLISTSGFADLKEHVKSIDESKPAQSQTPTSKSSDQRKNEFDANFKSNDPWDELWWSIFGPVLGIFVMPVAPITYHLLNLPNRSLESLPVPESKEMELGLGTGSSFSVTSLNLKYKIESSALVATADFDRERGFWTNFYSFYYSYTPNWKKQFKTGIGIGLKGFNYSDDTLNTQGSQSGLMLNFPTEYYFRESLWSLFYIPQVTYYSNGMLALEIKIGSSYEVSKNIRLYLSLDNKAIVTKKDLTYGTLGIRYLF